MNEKSPRRNSETEDKKEYGVLLADLEKDDGAIMLGIYEIYKEKVPGSKLTVDPDRVPKSFIMHLLRDIEKMKDPDSEDTRFNWKSDLSDESYLWVNRISERGELTVRFSLNISDFNYLSDGAQNDAITMEHDFNSAVNKYLEESGVGVQI